MGVGLNDKRGLTRVSLGWLMGCGAWLDWVYGYNSLVLVKGVGSMLINL